MNAAQQRPEQTNLIPQSLHTLSPYTPFTPWRFSLYVIVFLPQFLCFYPPIWCVWTWPLWANSLPWTPSAVRLFTVNWAWRPSPGGTELCRHLFSMPPSAHRNHFSLGAPRIDTEGVTKWVFVKRQRFTYLIFFSGLNGYLMSAPQNSLHLFSLRVTCPRLDSD